MFEFLAAHGAALLFYLFAAIAVAGALAVVLNRNPMYGAVGLLVSFLAIAGLFVLRHAEFLAVVQVFVYGGGIMVLFLFVIMLVNLHRLTERKMLGAYWKSALLVVFLLVGIFGFLFLQIDFSPAYTDPAAFVSVEGEAMGNSEAVAWKLYREYLLPFEIASVFLLVAMVGAVVLGRRA
jgi:NADH-quinone oxidoreductase subunit J